MFVFLSKKIAIPNGAQLHSLSWNSAQGWIACGGENGLLKVLKLETSADSKARGVAAPSNLSMNQTLEGHQGSVVCSTWNATHRKLTTSDQYGLIIVWMLHRGMWFEEMINNRNKSVVKDMKWTADGQKICIAYADGAVIVGGVDGNRLWAKELGMDLLFVEWSPDGRNILFSNTQGHVYLYDNQGNKISRLPLHAAASAPSYDEDGEEEENPQGNIVGIDWYDGSRGRIDVDAPDLAIAFTNGKVQITCGVATNPTKSVSQRGESKNDDGGDKDGEIVEVTVNEPKTVLIDTGMKLAKCQWNCNGSILALAGSQVTKLANGEVRKLCMVQFYSPFGQHLKTLKVPGKNISALTWEGSGLRIALAVDSFIFFANIRLDYRWGFFSNTVCYAYNKPSRQDHSVVFWDTHSGEHHTKHIKHLVAVRAAGENCVLASRADDKVLLKNKKSGGSTMVQQHSLVLCNAIGSPVDSKDISVNPVYLAMTACHVIAANEHAVYVWQYRSPVSKLASIGSNTGQSLGTQGLLDVTNSTSSNSAKSKHGREHVFHIDADPSRTCVSGLGYISKTNMGKKSGDTKKLLIDILTKGTADAITCIAANDRCLVVGRESGTIQKYTLPHISLENKYVVRCRPQKIALNCNSTKVSVIDINGVMTFLDLEKRYEGANGQTQIGEQLDFERKDAWDMMWAEDNPDLIAVMEKTRLYVFRGLEPEEPVLSSGYLCKHSDLQIKAVMLDEIMQQPTTPENDTVVDFPTKSLRDVREILKNVGVEEAFAYIETHPHPRLWKLIAEASLERLEFGVADKSFVQCSDYPGIQFVKNLKMLNDKVKQKAQVSAYFERFDEAESLYCDIDRKDLAIDLRMMLGDWFRVVQLVQMGGGSGDDELLRRAWKEIGDYYASRQKWNKAVQYYASAKEPAALVECYYLLEEYMCLEKLVRIIPQGSPLLCNIGKKFQSVGMSQSACLAFLKAGDVKSAIDCCVLLNHWDQAVKLAQEHEFPQIEGLLAKYASHLLGKGEKLQAIELYRKAKKSTQAATLLASLAQDAGKTKVDPLGAKKLHVLAAMEMEELRTRVLDTQIKNMGITGSEVKDPDAEDEDDFVAELRPARTKARMKMTAANQTAATLETLVQLDAATGENRSLDNAWKGAEAYHLFMLAQRQLYKGEMEAALVTSLQLRQYDDVLEPREVHSLIALTAYYNEAWGQCSKAFIELESLKAIACSKEDKEQYTKLALSIFRSNRPTDPPDVAELVASIDMGRAKGHPICMMSGRPIDEKRAKGVYKCRRCSRKMHENQLGGMNHC
eukprot:CAMPEP_0203752874 /NCGR_PEP_ID=MMETSP0098-20131031/6733_1 /ASSEMBLY_ACC=CAM_ASM_000208 /TAXON_ID=96639 /ORGANISM=" , Strain NY0313808BC1" /LENGTH=1294 /DNA_ID=CAMNT_0050643241 /DNA_START=364 /DNA_END=4245 /DNA_ORIENTATION=-